MSPSTPRNLRTGPEARSPGRTEAFLRLLPFLIFLVFLALAALAAPARGDGPRRPALLHAPLTPDLPSPHVRLP